MSMMGVESLVQCFYDLSFLLRLLNGISEYEMFIKLNGSPVMKLSLQSYAEFLTTVLITDISRQMTALVAQCFKIYSNYIVPIW